jgi:hypothetical protein
VTGFHRFTGRLAEDISVSRKLLALKVLEFDGLDLEVHRVAVFTRIKCFRIS